MKHLKYFKESSYSNDLDKFEVEDIKNIFQEIIDDWDLYDLSKGRQLSTRIPYCKIEYLYLSKNCYLQTWEGRLENRCINIFSATRLFRTSKSIKDGISIYINLAGPNDFYTTRIDFLNDLDKIVINRLINCGFDVDLIADDISSNHFILNIQTKK
jgi:hypothetical protein